METKKDKKDLGSDIGRMVPPSRALAHSWAIKFPAIASEITAVSTDSDAFVRLCDVPNRARKVISKSVSFERPATNDESLFNLVKNLSLTFNTIEVVLRPVGDRAHAQCRLRLSGVRFIHYSIVMKSVDAKQSIECFKLSYEHVDRIR